MNLIDKIINSATSGDTVEIATLQGDQELYRISGTLSACALGGVRENMLQLRIIDSERKEHEFNFFETKLIDVVPYGEGILVTNNWHYNYIIYSY